jgi:hypothetical protein
MRHRREKSLSQGMAAFVGRRHALPKKEPLVLFPQPGLRQDTEHTKNP